MAVEGPIPRDQVVTFTAHFLSYVPGDTAGFTAAEVTELTNLGVIGTGAAPVNVDVPAIAQIGDQLKCTDGNWDNVPHTYHHQWQLDGADAGFNSDIFWIAAGDVGKSAVCIVTATNNFGSTTAPATNAVVIVAPS